MNPFDGTIPQELTFICIPHFANTSIMIGIETGGVGMVVEGRWFENVAAGSAAMDFPRPQCR
jgi:hypothetical protein